MMIHSFGGAAHVEARRSLARWNLDVEWGRAPIRYGLSVACVAIALGLALACRRYGFLDAELALFDLAIVVVTWYAGVGPAVLAVALSTAAFDYLFPEPYYSFGVSSAGLPYFFLFMGSAVGIGWF